jgi:hypothetical protein
MGRHADGGMLRQRNDHYRWQDGMEPCYLRRRALAHDSC